ncbi:hypothetical protein ACRALDRAFT_2031700 [Sodiomyces alcalophilus JCM 7366]|uniref:uncharacterized protein n=1 Tax=Sodiomyces alcalophilus JCM 7366 TaxID=591952 RepID=UPI0039B45D4B
MTMECISLPSNHLACQKCCSLVNPGLLSCRGRLGKGEWKIRCAVDEFGVRLTRVAGSYSRQPQWTVNK